MPNTAPRNTSLKTLEENIRKWLARIPGAEQHVSGFRVGAMIPKEFMGRVDINDDPSGNLADDTMRRQMEESVLVMYGDKIYPPMRHALMLLAKDPDTGESGAHFGLRYEKGVSQSEDEEPYIKSGKHYSRIIGNSIASLEGKLERHISAYAVQDRLSGFLGLLYASLAREDSPRVLFSEYQFSQSKTPPNSLVLEGEDDLAIKTMTEKLNKLFSNDDGWQPLIPEASSSLTVPVDFFNNTVHMQALAEIVPLPSKNPPVLPR